jgi:RNA polymerase sigma-70 factor (ECF subfamily)
MTTSPRTEFRHALRSTADGLLAYFERRLRSRDDAADLLGETMLQAWRRIDAFPRGDAVRQRRWLFTIAANVLGNHYRSTNRRTALTERLRAHLSTTPTPPDAAETTAIRDAVIRLKDAHRELVMLIHWDGFSLVEAAEILRLNPSTARGRYAAARSALREALAETVCR